MRTLPHRTWCMEEEVKNIEQALDKIDQAAQGSDPVSLGTIVEGVGSRTFGPLLLLAGIVMTSPLSGIPGIPTSMSLLVLVIAAQLLIGRKHFWLPNWILRRSVSRKRLNKAISWLKKPAGFVDRLLRPRLAFLVHPIGTYIIAVMCTVIAAGMPFMEVVPFSASAAGVAICAFGVALVAQDGAIALFGYAWTGVTLYLIGSYLL
jgi:hypothetical protein